MAKKKHGLSRTVIPKGKKPCGKGWIAVEIKEGKTVRRVCMRRIRQPGKDKGMPWWMTALMLFPPYGSL